MPHQVVELPQGTRTSVEAAQDLGMPLSLHIFTNRPGPGQEFQGVDTSTANFMANIDHWVRMSLGSMIFGG